MSVTAQQECLETASDWYNKEAEIQSVALTANQKKKRRKKLSKLKLLDKVQLWYCTKKHQCNF